MKRTLLAIAVVLLAASMCIFSRSERTDGPPAPPRDATASRDAAREQLPATTERTPLRVRIVDARGRAREGIAISFWWRLAGSSDVVRRATGLTSDAQGMVLVRDFRRYMDELASRDVLAAAYGVCADGFGANEPSVTLDVAHLTSDPVVLVVPPCGTVTLVLCDASGQELRQSVESSLRALHEPGMTTRLNKHDNELAVTPIRFVAVPVGQRLRLNAHTLADDNFARDFAGLAQDGEEIVLRWRFDDARAVVTGCVQEPDGTPAAHRRFAAAIYDHEQRLTDEPYVATDARGRFAWALPHRSLEARAQRLHLDEISGASPSGRRASATFERPLSAGTHDLGTLTLAELPVILTCQVRDELGIGLPCTITVARPGISGKERFLLDPSGPALQRWLAHGHAEFRSATQAPVLLVRASGDEHVPSGKISFTRGTRDLRIVLEMGGALMARVDDLPVCSTVELRADAAPAQAIAPPQPWSLPIAYWPALRAGSYSLLARLPFDREPIVLATGLRVVATRNRAGLPTSEFRIGKPLKSIVVRAADAAGRPINDYVSVFALQNLGVHEAEARRQEDGSCVLHYAGAASFVVTAHGCRPKQVLDATSDVTVTLEPGARVRTRLAKVDLPEGVVVFCTATRRDAVHLAWGHTPEHRPGQIAELTPIAPGPYVLRYIAAKRGPTASLVTRSIEVLDLAEPQLFELACTPAALAEALAELRR